MRGAEAFSFVRPNCTAFQRGGVALRYRLDVIHRGEMDGAWTRPIDLFPPTPNHNNNTTHQKTCSHTTITDRIISRPDYEGYDKSHHITTKSGEKEMKKLLLLLLIILLFTLSPHLLSPHPRSSARAGALNGVLATPIATLLSLFVALDFGTVLSSLRGFFYL